MQFLGFLFPQGSAEALFRWGGKVKHLFIVYFLSNTSAKNYQNGFMYVKVIARQISDSFETQCIHQMLSLILAILWV